MNPTGLTHTLEAGMSSALLAGFSWPRRDTDRAIATLSIWQAAGGLPDNREDLPATWKWPRKHIWCGSRTPR
jgi:hypothetical protein